MHTLTSKKTINLDTIDNSYSNNEIYYKERWIKENNLGQRLIVSYSPKYAAYQKSIRNNQVIRAEHLIENHNKLPGNRQSDSKRFITSTYITNDGEIANSKALTLNTQAYS